MTDLFWKGPYWVKITKHPIWSTGALFLVVAEYPDGNLRCWADGIVPKHVMTGSIIHRKYVERV